MSTTVTYKGSTLTTVENQTRTLLTAGKYMEDDITLTDVTQGGGGVVITDTTDSHGGTIREITAVELSLATKTITANGTYDPQDDNVDGYTEVTVNVPQGVIVPTGFKYYNGYLLPEIPYIDGYNYAFIRMNNAHGDYDLVVGKSNWRVNTSSTLNGWQLQFATITTDGARQYSIPQNGTTTTATTWGEYTRSTASYYGTSDDRKLIWSSHDITIGTTDSVMYKRGYPIG